VIQVTRLQLQRDFSSKHPWGMNHVVVAVVHPPTVRLPNLLIPNLAVAVRCADDACRLWLS
jgi:hypothetical protein